MSLKQTPRQRLKSQYKRALATIGLLLAFILIFYIIKFGRYYYSEVYPYHAIAKDIITDADPEHQRLSLQMQTMIDADFYCGDDADAQGNSKTPQCGISKELQIAKLMQFHLSARHQDRALLRRFQEILVSYLVVHPLSQKEQNLILSELTFFTPEARNFNAFSQFYFHKPLSKLTLDEMATLVAITKAPSNYLRDDEPLQQRREWLLERYQLIATLNLGISDEI